MEDEDALIAAQDTARLDEEMTGAPDDDVFELEVDGTVHTLPGALRGAFLRQADYTRKTQELAGHRREVEAEREALSHRRRGFDDEAGDRATLTALERHLREFDGIDWQALGEADPRRAGALRKAFHETRALRDEFAYALARHEAGAKLDRAREAAEAMAEAGRTLSREIDGWSPDVAVKLVEYAQAFGVTPEELAEAADARLWKLLHKAWKADQAGQGDPEAMAVRPAVVVSSGGAGGSGPRAELGTKEWMRRRNKQVTGAR
ncbi:MAG: hypothetical protein JNL41_10825 [Phenylobacterium sp.]|uniref:hypothetical protein n=1 Tax=Phenylobacterium sp. TaxID=1871053 RepID=UPI001A610054|nr:hypothetical protein [Phenylobacterium sp.]MBL8554762.1 hypothetical protein [Phenylobacterium sp.]